MIYLQPDSIPELQIHISSIIFPKHHISCTTSRLDVLNGISNLTWLHWPELFCWRTCTALSPGKGMRHAEKEHSFITMSWRLSRRLVPTGQHYCLITVWWTICTWSWWDFWKALPLRLGFKKTPVWPAGYQRLHSSFHFGLPHSEVFHAHLGGFWSKREGCPGMSCRGRTSEADWGLSWALAVMQLCLRCVSLFGCRCYIASCRSVHPVILGPWIFFGNWTLSNGCC